MVAVPKSSFGRPTASATFTVISIPHHWARITFPPSWECCPSLLEIGACRLGAGKPGAISRCGLANQTRAPG